MCGNRECPLRISFGAVPTASGRLDPQPITLLEPPLRLGGHPIAVHQVPPRRPRLAALPAVRRVPPTPPDQRVAHGLRRLQFAHDAIATAVGTCATAAAPHRELADQDGELRLERLD